MGNELNFEGKKYISARRASEITGYNSDYIGQLCRKGSLECRLVGRSWFVGEISLSEHEVEAKKTPRGRIPISQKESRAGAVVGENREIEEKQEKRARQIEINKQVVIRPTITDTPATFNDSYLSFRSSDHGAFLHTTFKFDKRKVGITSFSRKVVAVCVVIFIFVLSAPYFIKGGVDDEIKFISRVGSNVAREINLSISPRLASVASSVNYLQESLFYEGGLLDSLKSGTYKFASETYQTISSLPKMFSDAARGMKRIVMNGLWSNSNSRDTFPVNKDGERSGVTVVPSTGDKEKDEELKQYIKDSFSGETNVLPDETGDSGVIKPIFKKQDNQDYLYVIVPVKDQVKK